MYYNLYIIYILLVYVYSFSNFIFCTGPHVVVDIHELLHLRGLDLENEEEDLLDHEIVAVGQGKVINGNVIDNCMLQHCDFFVCFSGIYKFLMIKKCEFRKFKWLISILSSCACPGMASLLN